MKFKLKHVLVLALSVIAIGGAAGFTASITAKAADTYEFSLIESLPTSVYKGDTITVPKAKFGSLNAKHYVYTPNGGVYSSDSVSCSTHGVYTVKYYASSEQGMLTHVEKITVENPVYYFDGTESSATYVENEEVTGRSGLLVNLKKGEKFYFNDLVNVNDCNSAQPVLKFTLAPQVDNQHDAQEFTVTFTDAYNPENSVSYWFNLGYGNTSSAWNFIRAKASGQTYKGFEGSKLHVNTFGAPFTFYAKDSFKDENININGILSKQYLSFYIDKDTRDAYLGYHHFKLNGSYSGRIIDLDDVSYQEADWNGFTTGEVYVSIECDKYISDSANILLLSVGDKDLSASRLLGDSEAPYITVDTLGYTEVPAASKGLSYPVFEADAFDRQSGGTIDLTAKVYYAYTRDSGVYHEEGAKFAEEIAIENGYFKTSKTGVYSIVYASYDYAGNYTERVVSVTCGETLTEINGVNLKAGYATTAQVGNKVKLAEIADGASGGIGALSEKFVVTYNGATQTVYGNAVNGYYFIPAGTGEYKVSAGVEDMLKNFKCVSYVVNVAVQTSPSFIEEPVLPKYLIAGAEYVLPEAYGKLTGSNTVQTATVTVTDGEGARDYELGSAVSFSADASGNATIKYYFGDNAIETVIPVISVINDDETIDLSK